MTGPSLKTGETVQLYFKGAGAYAWLALLCAALYIPGLVTLPPIDRDEARFAQASRQMVESGDYVRIRFQEEPRHKKPIGIYWLQAGVVKTLGGNASRHIWPYRIPSFLGATLAVLLTFMWGRRMTDPQGAFLGAGLLAGSLLLVFEAHQATTDAVLLAAVVASQGALAALYLRQPEDVPRSTLVPAVIFWFAQGAGILIKGPVVPIITLLTLAALIVMDRRAMGRLKGLHPLPGLLGVALMVLPWGIAITKATGGAFFTDAIGKDLLPKLVSGQESHGFMPGYYLLLLPLTFWPASLFLGPTLLWAWKQRRQPEVRFLLAWILPAWVLFELVPTKLPHYILPTYPALALLTAQAAFAAQKEDFQWPRFWPAWLSMALGLFVGSVLAAGTALMPWLLDGRFDPWSLWPILFAPVTLGSMVWYLRHRQVTAGLAAAILGAVLILGPALQNILPQVGTFWLSNTIVREIATRDKPPGTALPPIVAAGYHEPSLVFLAGTETGLLSPEEAAEALSARPGTLAVLTQKVEPAFLAKAQELGIALHVVRTLEGFHYSKGRWVTLKVYSAQKDRAS